MLAERNTIRRASSKSQIFKLLLRHPRIDGIHYVDRLIGAISGRMIHDIDGVILIIFPVARVFLPLHLTDI
jgi:hypothetical protein